MLNDPRRAWLAPAFPDPMGAGGPQDRAKRSTGTEYQLDDNGMWSILATSLAEVNERHFLPYMRQAALFSAGRRQEKEAGGCSAAGTGWIVAGSVKLGATTAARRTVAEISLTVGRRRRPTAAKRHQTWEPGQRKLIWDAMHEGVAHGNRGRSERGRDHRRIPDLVGRGAGALLDRRQEAGIVPLRPGHGRSAGLDTDQRCRRLRADRRPAGGRGGAARGRVPAGARVRRPDAADASAVRSVAAPLQ